MVEYNPNKWKLGSLRHPETGLWSHEPGTSFPCEKSVQVLNRVVDWFDKNNNNCDWIVKTAASRGTQNRFLSRKSEITRTKQLLWRNIAKHQLSGTDFRVQTKLTFRQYLTLNINTCNRLHWNYWAVTVKTREGDLVSLSCLNRHRPKEISL